MLFFPTTVLCVDDKEASFHHVSEAVASGNSQATASPHQAFHATYFSNAQEALETVKAHSVHPFQTLSKRLSQSLFETPLECPLEYPLEEEFGVRFFEPIHRFIQNPRRYETISAVISDYDMPLIVGDLLLSQTPPHMYKMMLTEVMPSQKAVGLLNGSKIDWFLRKENGELVKSLSLMLPKIFDHFFFKQQFYPQNHSSVLNQAVLALAKKHTMVEAYLVDVHPPVAYLMIDAQGYETLVHFWTSLPQIPKMAEVSKSIQKYIRSGAGGYLLFRFDPKRRPKQAKDAICPLTVFEFDSSHKGVNLQELQDFEGIHAIRYHLMEIGQNVYSKGCFEAFKQDVNKQTV